MKQVGAIIRRRPAGSLAAVVLAALVALPLSAARKNSGNDDAGDSAPANRSDLPADVNQASLRVAAMDMIYELDLSIDQMHALRQLALDTASTRPRSHATNLHFAALLGHFEVALLDGTNDQTVARYRNEVMDQIESVEGLDDQIEPTGPAVAKAPQVCRKLKASQVAAFLASHADEVIDPTERMVEAVDEVRLAGADDVVNIERKISADVARMVAGLDQQKSKAIADKVMEWLKTAVASNKDELTDAKRAALEQSAAKVIGDVSNIEILDHYLQSEMAVLLSNPQIIPAIDSLGNARVREQQK